jgi:hypothetical protein
MTHQWYSTNEVYEERAACLWVVCHGQTMLPHRVDALSERVPDRVLRYVFTHKAEDKVSSAAHTAQAVEHHCRSGIGSDVRCVLPRGSLTHRHVDVS